MNIENLLTDFDLFEQEFTSSNLANITQEDIDSFFEKLAISLTNLKPDNKELLMIRARLQKLRDIFSIRKDELGSKVIDLIDRKQKLSLYNKSARFNGY